MKKLLTSLILIGSVGFLVLACEPIEEDFEQPMDQPTEQEEGDGF